MKVIKIGELPLSLKLAKAHLRVSDATHDDELITAKLEMAVAVAEDMTGRLIREREIEMRIQLPVDDTILVQMPLHTAVITELSSKGGILTPEEDYQLFNSDSEDLLFVYEKFEGQQLKAKITVGYNKETIPPAIKAAILLILGTLYDNESDNIVGRSVSELSLTAEKLLQPWRVTPYGNV